MHRKLKLNNPPFKHGLVQKCKFGSIQDNDLATDVGSLPPV